MMPEEKTAGTEEEKMTGQRAEEGTYDECADIKDPVRRGLCKICQAPVVGEAPFCQDHEPPVP